MLHHLSHPYQLLGVVVAVAVGLFGHNVAQAWAAKLFGLPGPVRAGYGGLTPARQLDPFGVVCSALVHYGWGFPAAVPLIPRFRRERARSAAALVAGPLFLLVLCGGFLLILRSSTSGHLVEFCAYGAVSAAGLCVTSCLPIPPLSGGWLLFLYAPVSPGWARARYQLTETQAGALIALAILLIPSVFPALPDVVGQLAGPLVRGLASLLDAPRLYP